MARIFNIYFTYEGKDYTAVVSVRTTAFFTEYALNNLNDSVLELLPGNKIVSRDGRQFSFLNAAADNPEALMEAIIRAVTEHLHTTEV